MAANVPDLLLATAASLAAAIAHVRPNQPVVALAYDHRVLSVGCHLRIYPRFTIARRGKSAADAAFPSACARDALYAPRASRATRNAHSSAASTSPRAALHRCAPTNGAGVPTIAARPPRPPPVHQQRRPQTTRQ